jgi:hypothetical protein
MKKNLHLTSFPNIDRVWVFQDQTRIEYWSFWQGGKEEEREM